MSATLCETPASLGPELLDRWRQLAEARENPFLTPEWTLAWHESQAEERPFTLLWTQEGELRGVLPLARPRRGPLHFAGARRGDWFTPACAPADEEAMARDCAQLLGREGGGRLLRLDRVDTAGAWPQALWAAGSPLAPARARRRDTLPFVDLGAGWDGYLAGRSRNFRSQLGRRRRKLEREHGLGFRLAEDRDRLEADLDLFWELHEERWSGRGGSSSGGEATQRFQRRFAAAALERGWLRLWIAEADGEPAAAWYGWRLGNRYCYALSGFRQRYEELSIGTVLLAHTIEQAAAEGATVYDLMWGEEPYKQRFETGRREAATWVLGRRRSPRTVAAALRTTLERGARRAVRR
ncbi:MAG TPA: GNAT family N-acetyltransferase [Solirubrobacterales bacterium]|nr:GNAT family N-acetyltransferase [Solirubrobacterales bacterium]